MGALQISYIDVAIIIVYFVGVVLLGVWISRRKIKGHVDFFLAGRQMTWPLVGASLFSTNISSQQFVGQAGAAFTFGIIMGGFQMIGAMCFVFLAVFFLQAYRGLKLFTSPEFFEKRFSPGCRTVVSAVNLLMLMTATVSAALYAGATVLMTLLGWKGPGAMWTAVIVLGVTTGIYTLLGGLRSVIYTDFVQNILLVLGGAVTLIVGIILVGRRAGGGFYCGITELLSLRDATGGTMWSLIKPAAHTYGWLPMLTGTFILGVHGHCTDQDYVQRALAAKNLFHAKMGAIFAAFLKVLALFIIAAPGVIAARLFPELDSGDKAYATLLIEVMPIGLVGLCLAGLLAAIMSSVDSGLCAASSLLTFDFVGKKLSNASDKFMLVLGRYFILILLVIAVVWAPFIQKFKGLYDYLVQIWALIAPPVFVCVIFGLFYKRSNSRGAIATLIVGSLLGAVSFGVLNVAALEDIKAKLPWYFQNSLNVGFTITLICSAVMLLVSRLSTSTAEDEAKAQAIKESRNLEPMTLRQQRIYRITLGVLLLVWFGVLLAFSPLGLGR